MSSVRQIQANRRNAQLSTGPATEEGKARSRQNAVRHGLTAETVINALEDADDYAAFELAVTFGYEPRSAVERELVLRLASVLWRLRRATAIESGLFEVQAQDLRCRRRGRAYCEPSDQLAGEIDEGVRSENPEPQLVENFSSGSSTKTQLSGLAQSFVRLTNQPTSPLDRLGRYEASLWRQACQLTLLLQKRAQR